MKKKPAKKSDVIMQPVLIPGMPGMIGMEGLAPTVMWVPVKKRSTLTTNKKLAVKKTAATKSSTKNLASKSSSKSAAKKRTGKASK